MNPITQFSKTDEICAIAVGKTEGTNRKNRESYAVSCHKGNDEIKLCPILDWTWNDVWNYRWECIDSTWNVYGEDERIYRWNYGECNHFTNDCYKYWWWECIP